MKWWGVNTGSNVFFFQAMNETEAYRIALRDFGSSDLTTALPMVLGEFNKGAS